MRIIDSLERPEALFEANTEHLELEGIVYRTQFTEKFRHRRAYTPDCTDCIRVPAVIPGVIERVHVQAGARVRRGQPLLVLDAMKMQNEVVAPSDGTVQAINVIAGQKVGKAEVLVEIA